MAICLFVLVLLASILSLFSFNKNYNELKNEIENIKECFETENIDNQLLLEKTNTLCEKWDTAERSFLIYFHHSALTHIQNAVSKLETYILFEKYGDYLAEINTISDEIDDLKDITYPSSKNLL